MSDWNIAAKPQEERDKVNVDWLPRSGVQRAPEYAGYRRSGDA